MKQSFSFSIMPVLVSGIIGMAVACLFNLIFRDPWPVTALKGSLSGSLIGACAEAAFLLTARWINRKPLLSFAAVLLVIAAGTAVFMRLFTAASPVLLFSVIAVSEIVGLAATVFFWRYSRRMNERLAETKKHFTSRK